MCKLPFATYHYRKGQKVWVRFTTGGFAYSCVGRYGGSGRYVNAWVNWESTSRPALDWKWIEVDDDFAERHGLATR